MSLLFLKNYPYTIEIIHYHECSFIPNIHSFEQALVVFIYLKVFKGFFLLLI